MTSEGNDDRLDAGLKAAFPASPKSIVVKIGAQPISLRDESSGLAPLVRPRSLDVPSGREGRYQILGEIARGGMGVVVRGHDVDLGRDVAIKVLREDHATKPDVVQRFVEEAQIGGQLQHPGIVPVYELGQRSDQRPFFTMKLVKGKTLAALLADRPDPTHDRRRFLSIFEAVCHTMAYAHARGVIHRDLKPANVMLGAFGEVQIVDWGMGKVLGHGGVADERLAKSRAQLSIIATVRSERDGSDSLAGSVMGTPAYMSPEQARGAVNELDERCDVFSLGAILCEILTGQPPYVGEALTKAVNADLADATARLEGCGADDDLVRLAKSCLVPAAIARPKDASVLAAAIGAHLASVEERAQKSQLDAAESKVKATEERRRRKLSLALAASVVALVVLGGAGWVAIESARRERIAEATHAVSRALDEAALLAGKAEASDDLVAWHEAVAAAKRAESLAESKDADPATHARAHEIATRLEAGERAATAKAEQRAKDQAMVARLDEIRGSRADHWNRNLTADEYRDAFRTYDLDLATMPTSEVVRRVRDSAIVAELVAALDDWALVSRDVGGAFERVVAVVKASDDDPWRSELRNATTLEDLHRLAARVDVESMTISGLDRLANRLGDQGDPRGAAALAKTVAQRHPEDFWALFAAACWAWDSHPSARDDAEAFYTAAVAVRPHSFVVHNNLGVVLQKKGDVDGAIAEYREAIRLVPDYALPHANIAKLLWSKGDFDGAVAECHEALRARPDYVYAHDLLGVALMSRGESYGALAEFREAIRLDPKNAEAHNHLGFALVKMGDPVGAIAEQREAVRLQPDNAGFHADLGIAIQAAGDLDGAIQNYEEAIKLDPDLADAHDDLALALKAKGDLDGALRELREEVRLAPASAAAHLNLAHVLFRRGDIEGAIAESREAIRLQPDNAAAHYGLGLALQAKGDLAGAIVEFRQAILLESSHGPAHNALAWLLATTTNEKLRDPGEAVRLARRAAELDPNNANSWNTLGVALYEHGDFRDAVSALSRSIEIGKEGIPADWLFLAMAHQRLGEVDEATRAYRNAIVAIEKLTDAGDETRRFRAEAERVLGIAKETK